MSNTIDTATSSTMQEPSIFEEEWQQSLDAYDLNADVNARFLHGGDPLIDPQLLGTQPSPDSSFSALLGHESTTGPCKIEGTGICPSSLDVLNGMTCTIGTETSNQSDISSISTGHMDQGELDELLESFENDHPYPVLSHSGQVPSTPYFNEGIAESHGSPMSTRQNQYSMPLQQQRHPGYRPSPLRHQMSRRSVSEPPTGPPDSLDSGDLRYHLYQPPSGQMVFHRQGHYIGKPVPNEVPRVKGRARGRPLNRCKPYKTNQRIVGGDGGSPRQFELASAPTSAPSPSLGMAPSHETASSTSSPGGQRIGEPGFWSPVVSIAVSEEQFQKMITEAVAKAISDLRGSSVILSTERASGDSEDIVIAGRDQTPGV